MLLLQEGISAVGFSQILFADVLGGLQYDITVIIMIMTYVFLNAVSRINVNLNVDTLGCHRLFRDPIIHRGL